MKDLLDYIVKGIVSRPNEVVINESQTGQEVSYILNVNPEDMGIVIGKKGQTIKAIRKLLAVRAMADNIRVNLQIVEPSSEALT